MCQVNNFCGGCSLRSGAITAAVITFFVALLYLTSGILGLKYAADIENHSVEPRVNPEERKQLIMFFRAYAGTSFVCCVISFIIFICLVIAIRSKSPGFVLPFLIFSMIEIVLSCITNVFGLIGGNWYAIGGLLIVALQIYLWIVVLNFYRQLKDRNVSTIKA